MPEREKLVCQDCGAEMNRHAEKVDYASGLERPDALDPELGGLLEEFHTCPECGRTAARIVE